MPGHRAVPRRRASMLRRSTTALTWLLGAVGATVLAWLVFSLVTGAQVVVFKTGSMSPTMPTGSAAISLPVTASEIRVGDVITVTRPGQALPVTHRVVELGPMDGSTREVTLQGDANAEPDVRPYQVGHALRVLWAVPGLGPALAIVKTPAVMAGLTIVVAALIVAAFWPRPEEDGEPMAGDPAASGDPGDPAAPGDPADTGDPAASVDSVASVDAVESDRTTVS